MDFHLIRRRHLHCAPASRISASPFLAHLTSCQRRSINLIFFRARGRWPQGVSEYVAEGEQMAVKTKPRYFPTVIVLWVPFPHGEPSRRSERTIFFFPSFSPFPVPQRPICIFIFVTVPFFTNAFIFLLSFAFYFFPISLLFGLGRVTLP